MNKALAKGKTLLVSGPASIILTEGEVSALGYNIPSHKRIIVRHGKTIPLEAMSDSVLEIFSGNNLGIKEIDGEAVPDVWKTTVEAILSLPKPCTVAVLGGVDVGKNTFCLFLANKLLANSLAPTIVDADIGQAEIGPSMSIGLAKLREPTLDLFSLNPEDVFFVGSTSPSGVTQRVIGGLIQLRKRSGSSPFTIVNTDGWVREEVAVRYKARLVEALNPEAAVVIQKSDELEPLISLIKSKVFRVAPPSTSRRDREERRELREQSYRKFLRGAASRTLPLGWVKLESASLSSDTGKASNRLMEIEGVFDRRLTYCDESPEEIRVIIDDSVLDADCVAAAEKSLGKAVRVVGAKDLQGLILGLLGEYRRFLGLGIVDRIDFEGKTLRITTLCKEKISIVQFSQTKIDKSGREVDWLSAPYD